VKINPRVTRNSIHVLTAAIAGPALIVAGLRYPGNWKAKGFLIATGIAVLGTHYYMVSSDIKLLMKDGEPDEG
jgi:hypothetical protein